MKMVHVTIHTPKLEESIKFYEEIAGLKIERDMRAMGGNIVFLSNAEAETCVELLEDTENAYSGSGISIGFHTEDVEKLHEELTGKGLNPSPIISPNPHVAFFFVKDPSGVTVQFI